MGCGGLGVSERKMEREIERRGGRYKRRKKEEEGQSAREEMEEDGRL